MFEHYGCSSVDELFKYAHVQFGVPLDDLQTIAKFLNITEWNEKDVELFLHEAAYTADPHYLYGSNGNEAE